MATIDIALGTDSIMLEAREDDTRLVDLCDEASMPHLFACRSGNCGICLMEVVAGGSLIAPAGDPERSVLRRLGAVPAQRLGCQVKVAPASGLIRLRLANRTKLSIPRH